MLADFKEPGPEEDWETYKKKIIKSFVSSVYLYDDKLYIVYNVSHNKKTLDKSEISLLEAGQKCSTEGKSPAPVWIILQHLRCSRVIHLLFYRMGLQMHLYYLGQFRAIC